MDILERLVQWLKKLGVIPPAEILDALKEYNPEWGRPEFYTRPIALEIPSGTTLELRGHDGAI
jgi:hypothetical protein